MLEHTQVTLCVEMKDENNREVNSINIQLPGVKFERVINGGG